MKRAFISCEMQKFLSFYFLVFLFTSCVSSENGQDAGKLIFTQIVSGFVLCLNDSIRRENKKIINFVFWN